MLQKIFHGPRFTGHGDDVTRATPGERLILDARCWVSLCALLSGAGPEEWSGPQFDRTVGATVRAWA
jgi:hypothetical protein